MPKSKKEEVKPFNVWRDDTAPGQEFDHTDFMKRLKDVHGIDPATTKGTKKMLSHIDGDTWFSWNYEWEIAGKKFTQHTRNLRTGMDCYLWSDGE